MTSDPRDTPMDVADPGINPQLIAAMSLVEAARPAIAAMTSIRDQFITNGWDPLQAQKAALLLWQSAMVAGPQQQPGVT